MIKAVLFDLDGTLANSLIDLAAATNQALVKFGYPEREVDNFRYYAGDGIPKMIERALPEDARTSEIIDKVKADYFVYYNEHYNDSTCTYNGVPQLLDALESMGITMAVVTNKAQAFAEKVINKLFGDKYFSLVFGQRDGVPNKPDPTLTLMAMKELGVNPEECIFLGDSGMDVATGVNSGAYPVGELWGFRDEQELKENGAKRIILNPLELIDIIEELNG